MRNDCTISILVENQSSILTRILSLFTGRGFDINSIAVGTAENNKMSRLTLVLPGNTKIIYQITKQLYKLLPVVQVQNLTYIPSIKRELILCKIVTIGEERSKILEISTFFRAKVVDFTENVLTLEITGNPEKIVALEQLINKFGILELARTGRIALSRESLVNTKLVRSKKRSNKLKKLALEKSENSAFGKKRKAFKSYLDKMKKQKNNKENQ